MSDVKRKRSENWLEDDKLLLQNLVRERVNIIEHKNTDTNTNHKKKIAWEDLLNRFNQARKGSQRTISQLKTQWGILKINAKKQNLLHRQELRKTGGGPPVLQTSVTSSDINIWLPNEFVIEENKYDSDTYTATTLVKTTNTETEAPLNVPSHENIEMSLSDEPSTSSIKENTDPLNATETPKKPKLKKKQKFESANVQTNAALQIKQMKELHQIQMENEKLKSKYLRKKN